MAHIKKVTWSLCVYIISDTIHNQKKRKKKNHKSTLANISDKMFTERTDQIIRTQINRLFSVFDIYIFSSRVNQNKNLPQMPLPNACACIRACYRWPRLTRLSNGTWKHPNTNLKTGHSIQKVFDKKKSQSWENESEESILITVTLPCSVTSSIQ